MKMLVLAPYQAPAKKDKKKKKTKEAQGDLHPEETSGAVSGGTEAPSSGKEDEDEADEEAEEGPSPWDGVVVYRRDAAAQHIEYATTLERLGLADLSSPHPRARAAAMGIMPLQV